MRKHDAPQGTRQHGHSRQTLKAHRPAQTIARVRRRGAAPPPPPPPPTTRRPPARPPASPATVTNAVTAAPREPTRRAETGVTDQAGESAQCGAAQRGGMAWHSAAWRGGGWSGDGAPAGERHRREGAVAPPRARRLSIGASWAGPSRSTPRVRPRSQAAAPSRATWARPTASRAASTAPTSTSAQRTAQPSEARADARPRRHGMRRARPGIDE
jgi:hypothetical protein